MSVECKKCGKSFSSEEALQQHMGDYDHSKVKECPSCGETFVSGEAFEEHQTVHRNAVQEAAASITWKHGVGAVAILLVAGLVYWGGGTTSGSSPTTSTGANVSKVIEVSGVKYSFSPSTITVKKGERVKVDFTNVGRVPHNLRIPSLGVGTRAISGGGSSSFIFTAPESGSFPVRIECTLPGHAERGMVGQVQAEGS